MLFSEKATFALPCDAHHLTDVKSKKQIAIEVTINRPNSRKDSTDAYEYSNTQRCINVFLQPTVLPSFLSTKKCPCKTTHKIP